MEPTQNPSDAHVPASSHASLIVGGVLLLVAIGGALWYMETMKSPSMESSTMETTMPAPGTPEEIAASAEQTAMVEAAMATQSTSDELGSIEADLVATDLESLGDPSAL
jgi:hypothetical protein